ALASLPFNRSGFVAPVAASLNIPLAAADALPVLQADIPARLEVVPPRLNVIPTPPPLPRPGLSARVVRLKGQSLVKVFDAATGALRQTLKPFGGSAANVQAALIDVNGDGAKDLVVTARVNGKLRKKVYSGIDLSPLPSAPA